jgi:hypothetical protein
MRSMLIGYLLLSILLLAPASIGCDIPNATATVPPPPPTLPPSTKTPTIPTTQPTQIPQFSVLKLDAPGPAILPVNGLAGPAVGQRFAQQLAATGGMPPYTWTLAAGNMPPGLSLSPGGLISGTPSSPGAFSFTLVLTDSQGTSALGGTHTLNIASPPTSSTQSDLNPGGPMGVSKPAFFISFPQIRYYKSYESATWADLERNQYLVIVPFVYGGKLPWKFTTVGLPKGITCDPVSGLIHGPLTEAPDNIFTISVILTDADGTQANNSPAGFNLRLGYRAPTTTSAPPAGTKGTLSVSCGNGIASVSGYGDIGKGGGIVSLTAGSYVLTIRSPYTGKVVWQTNVRIDSGKTTVVKWDGYAE